MPRLHDLRAIVRAVYPFSSVTVDAQGAALVLPQGFYIETAARRRRHPSL
ncbi:hypothetical protein ACWGII_13955 [Streptomyces sp. NPDC054855]